ncbi:MAG: phosphatase PAP2 family protein [Mucinivorans sp.]
MNHKPLIAIILIAVFCLTLNVTLSAQPINRYAPCTDSCANKGFHSFRASSIIAPAALIALGAVVSFTPWGQTIDNTVQNAFMRDNFQQFRIDDYAQFLPLAAVYGLNLCGVRGRHNYVDLSIIAATASLIMFGAIHVTKELTSVLRPDGSAYNSFPSGHTAMAFVGAEILFQEYRHRSPWIGIGGYVFASAVGVMRLYNNRHWFSDIIAGAGVGILSTKIAYWLYPAMQRWFFPRSVSKLRKSSATDVSAMVMPFYNGEQAGAGISIKF